MCMQLLQSIDFSSTSSSAISCPSLIYLSIHRSLSVELVQPSKTSLQSRSDYFSPLLSSCLLTGLSFVDSYLQPPLPRFPFPCPAVRACLSKCKLEKQTNKNQNASWAASLLCSKPSHQSKSQGLPVALEAPWSASCCQPDPFFCLPQAPLSPVLAVLLLRWLPCCSLNLPSMLPSLVFGCTVCVAWDGLPRKTSLSSFQMCARMCKGLACPPLY